MEIHSTLVDTTFSFFDLIEHYRAKIANFQ